MKRLRCYVAAGLCAGSLGVRTEAASAGYTAIDLYTLQAPNGLSDPHPYNVFAGETVGWAGMPGNITHAVAWERDGSPVDLNPNGYTESIAFGTDGTHQFGQGYPLPYDGQGGAHALFWGGSAGSYTDLHPTGYFDSLITGSGGGRLVGYGAPISGHPHALLWTTAGAPAIDLHPTNLTGFVDSFGYGTSGLQQVGQGGGPATTDATHLEHMHALLWAGSANSAVDLNPTDLHGITDSSALATNGMQQVGQGNGHALLWSGTADSAVDLNPDGFAGSTAACVSQDHQAGWGTPTASTQTHALVWTGTAGSAIDLQLWLPQALINSQADSIDASGDVFGTAFGSTDHQWHVIEWLPHAVIPGDADLNGTVNFTDLLALAQHYGQSGGWVNGDFNDDGTVNFADLLALAQNYGQSTPSALASVPEPTVFALPLIVVLARRRRRCFQGQAPR